MTPARDTGPAIPSLQNGKRVEHKPPVSMSVHASEPASFSAKLKPMSNPDSPINSPHFLKRTGPGVPEMMHPPVKATKPMKTPNNLNGGRIDINTMEFDNTPYPGRVTKTEGKYVKLFASWKVGQRLKCAPENVPTVSNMARDWIKKTGKTGVVIRSCVDLGDGWGGVWLLKDEDVEP